MTRKRAEQERKMEQKKAEHEMEMAKLDKMVIMEELNELSHMLISSRDILLQIQEIGKLILGDNMENINEDSIQLNSLSNRNHCNAMAI